MDEKNELVELIKGFDEKQIFHFLQAAIQSPDFSEEIKDKFRIILTLLI